MEKEYFKNYNLIHAGSQNWKIPENPNQVAGFNLRESDILFWDTQKNVKIFFKKPDGSYDVHNEIIAHHFVSQTGIPTTEMAPIHYNETIGLGSVILYSISLKSVSDIEKLVNGTAVFRKLFVVNTWLFNQDWGSSKVDSYCVNYNGSLPYSWYAIDFSHTLTHVDGTHYERAIDGVSLNLNNCLGSSYITSFSDIEPYIKIIENFSDQQIENEVNKITTEFISNLTQEKQNEFENNAIKIISILKYRRDNLRKWLTKWVAQK